MSGPTQEQPQVTPEVTTAPAGSGWSRIPDHLGRARTSTVVLAVLFVTIFALYLNIRPEPTVPANAGTGGTTQGGTTQPSTAPATTTTAPETTQEQPTTTEVPTTSDSTGLRTPTPSGTDSTSAVPTPLPTPSPTAASPAG